VASNILKWTAVALMTLAAVFMFWAMLVRRL
jgi:hypothetical protein